MVCLSGGCASARWLDERTPGDLWNTAGTELPIFGVLGKAPPERRSAPARDELPGKPDDADRRRDAAIEILMAVFAIW